MLSVSGFKSRAVVEGGRRGSRAAFGWTATARSACRGLWRCAGRRGAVVCVVRPRPPGCCRRRHHAEAFGALDAQAVRVPAAVGRISGRPAGSASWVSSAVSWGRGARARPVPALEDALERTITEGGIESPVTTRRGLMACMRYLTTHQGGPAALVDAGITATSATLRSWTRGARRPRPANAEAIDAAYWNPRARNPGVLKQHLNNNARGTAVEIQPVNQDVVVPSRHTTRALRPIGPLTAER